MAIKGAVAGKKQAPDCEPGSIEQQLDMCEGNGPKGEEALSRRDERRHVLREADPENYEIDMSEEDREGDELSGDEHSSGLQGGEPEETEQDDLGHDVDDGIPGDRLPPDLIGVPLTIRQGKKSA